MSSRRPSPTVYLFLYTSSDKRLPSTSKKHLLNSCETHVSWSDQGGVMIIDWPVGLCKWVLATDFTWTSSNCQYHLQTPVGEYTSSPSSHYLPVSRRPLFRPVWLCITKTHWHKWSTHKHLLDCTKIWSVGLEQPAIILGIWSFESNKHYILKGEYLLQWFCSVSSLH